MRINQEMNELAPGTMVEVEGKNYPSSQINFLKGIISEPSDEIKRMGDAVFAGMGDDKHNVNPCLISEWINVIKEKDYENGRDTNIGCHPEIAAIVYLAHKFGYTLGEIAMMTSPLASSPRSRESASKSLSIITILMLLPLEGADE